VLTAVIGIVLALVFYEFVIQVLLRKFRAARAYWQALEVARAKQKPLIVIGDPDKGLRSVTGRDYGCGDLCIDLSGAPNCPKAVAGDALAVLSGMPGDSAVVFVAYVFEGVDDPDALLRECNRVSGGDTFMVVVGPWCPAGYLHPKSKWLYWRGRFVRLRRWALPY
jgi:hypothetical protein